MALLGTAVAVARERVIGVGNGGNHSLDCGLAKMRQIVVLGRIICKANSSEGNRHGYGEKFIATKLYEDGECGSGCTVRNNVDSAWRRYASSGE